jgi:hypothetical protein
MGSLAVFVPKSSGSSFYPQICAIVNTCFGICAFCMHKAQKFQPLKAQEVDPDQTGSVEIVRTAGKRLAGTPDDGLFKGRLLPIEKAARDARQNGPPEENLPHHRGTSKRPRPMDSLLQP